VQSYRGQKNRRVAKASGKEPDNTSTPFCSKKSLDAASNCLSFSANGPVAGTENPILTRSCACALAIQVALHMPTAVIDVRKALRDCTT